MAENMDCNQDFGPIPCISYLAPEDQFRKNVEAYVTAIQTEDSGIMCACIWKLNPLDMLNQVPEKLCRKLLDTVNDDCPVHSKQGFIRGFFAWIGAPMKEPNASE